MSMRTAQSERPERGGSGPSVLLLPAPLVALGTERESSAHSNN
jgi:hypothetical protein